MVEAALSAHNHHSHPSVKLHCAHLCSFVLFTAAVTCEAACR